MPTPTISSFRGEYDFLSNFYPSVVVYKGITYPSVENAFQAQKCILSSHRERFVSLSPGQAKRLGRVTTLREFWDDIRVIIMTNLVWLKFSENDVLKAKLLATKNFLLIEGNTWNDTFWGVCDGVGENKLGTILMYVRTMLETCQVRSIKTSVHNVHRNAMILRSPNYVYIGRGHQGQVTPVPYKGCYGNPFHTGTREEMVGKFREYFFKRIKEDKLYREAVISLHGCVLGCFCKPKLCHGDVYKEWLDSI